MMGLPWRMKGSQPGFTKNTFFLVSLALEVGGQTDVGQVCHLTPLSHSQNMDIKKLGGTANHGPGVEMPSLISLQPTLPVPP